MPKADLVLLDDAGNGYRDCKGAWPAVLRDSRATATIVYKCRCPLVSGALWETVRALHAARAIVILTADDLPSSGATISRSLS